MSSKYTERINRLERRQKWIEDRAVDLHDSSFDAAEASALKWAIPILRDWAVAQALSTSTSSGIEADTKPSGTLEENIEELLYEDVGFWDMNSEIEAAHLKQTVQRLLSLYQKELEKELAPWKGAYQLMRQEYKKLGGS